MSRFLRELWSSLFRRRTTTRCSSSDVIHVNSEGKVVAHKKSWKVERLTLL